MTSCDNGDTDVALGVLCGAATWDTTCSTFEDLYITTLHIKLQFDNTAGFLDIGVVLESAAGSAAVTATATRSDGSGG